MHEQPRLSLSVSFLARNGRLFEPQAGCVRVPAGTAGTWRIRLANVGPGIGAGAVLRLDRFNIQFAGKLQDTHPARRDYVRTTFSGNATIATEIIGGDRGVRISVQEGTWRDGEILEISFGDTSGGGPGSEVFWSTTEGRLTLRVQNGESLGPPVADDARIVVTDTGTVDRLRLLGPTTAGPGEEFALHAVVFDRHRNVVEGFTGRFTLECDGPVEGLPAGLVFSASDAGVHIVEGVTLAVPGVYRFVASDESLGVRAESNPVVCRNAGPSVFWGDPHNHGFGDSTMFLMHDRTAKLTPASRHEQARRVGRFDYAAVGAMSMPNTAERDNIWAEYRDTVKRLYRPGSYVPFLGMEMHPPEGDRMLFFKDDAEVPPAIRTPARDVYELYAQRSDAMLECHIGGSTPKYDRYLPGGESLVEVTSAFGNAEWLLQDMLQRGFRPAVTGASDLHLGLLGAPRAVEPFRGRFGYGNRWLSFRDSGFGSGPIGAVVAEELSHDGLWQALAERSGYASTGDRVFLELDAGGYRMGQVADLPAAFDLRIEVHAETKMRRIDLVVGTYRGASFEPGNRDFETTFHFDRDALPPGRWFYLRVWEENNEYAWSAPVWFEDGEERGDSSRDWPAWNATEKPAVSQEPQLREHLEALQSYLETHGDRGAFGDIQPVGIRNESMGTAALFVSQTTAEGYPVSIRWFYEFEIPRIRVDWGYEPFGVVNCERGPSDSAVPG